MLKSRVKVTTTRATGVLAVSPFEIPLIRPTTRRRRHEHRNWNQCTYNQKPCPIECHAYTETRHPFHSTLLGTARRSYSNTSNIHNSLKGGTSYDCIKLYDSLSTTYKQVPLAIQSTPQHDPNTSTRNRFHPV